LAGCAIQNYHEEFVERGVVHAEWRVAALA
jgi:hypothetical protein